MPWTKKSDPTVRADAREEEAADPTADRAEQESRLRRLVQKGINDARADADGRQEVIYKRPYYFRTYDVYPSDDFEIAIRQTDTRTAPIVADVYIEKQRFSTRMHRRREDAAADLNYLRDTGTEKLTYEMRNGRWTRAGSFFVADRTEEQINGEWVPLKEEVQRTLAAEEEQEGWWQRTWYWITGR